MRTIVSEAEEILDLYLPVRQFGYIALKDYMGSDSDIESSARVSYAKGTRKISDTRTLIRYLFRMKHLTPFESVSLKFHVKAPISVFRQWHRHRTGKINEISGRYSILEDDIDETPKDKWRKQSTDNKQGSSGYLDNSIGSVLTEKEKEFNKKAFELYKERIDNNVAKEQARNCLPVSTYSIMYWKCDLRNIFNFLSLRTDNHSQLEIREYANIMAGIVQRVCPIAYEAWLDYDKYAKSFSRFELEIINSGFITKQSTSIVYKQKIYEYLCRYRNLNIIPEGMSKREYNEFWNKLEFTQFDAKLDISTGIRKMNNDKKEAEIPKY